MTSPDYPLATPRAASPQKYAGHIVLHGYLRHPGESSGTRLGTVSQRTGAHAARLIRIERGAGLRISLKRASACISGYVSTRVQETAARFHPVPQT